MSRTVVRRALAGVGALALATSVAVVAQDAPESLLPPGFDTPAPAATPRPPAAAPSPGVPGTPAPTPAPAPAPTAVSRPVIQPLPPSTRERQGRSDAAPPASRQTIDEALLEELLELQRPKYDIPPGRSRSLEAVGPLDQSEGGLPQDSTARVSGAYLNAVIAGTRGPLVSRWGSILLRRAASSRLATPIGMDGADWAALRAQLLLRMGEAWPARSLVQEVESAFYTPALEEAALASYVATADILGICPVTAITAATRDGAEWKLVRAICDSFDGSGSQAMADLERYRRQGLAKNIDVLLAQKFAGAALEGRKAVTIEWTDVEELTPWRYGLALATGLEPPDALMAQSGDGFAPITARAPMLPLTTRAAAADDAAAQGILSSAAMVDLYSQIHSLGEGGEDWSGRTMLLRRAYRAAQPATRLNAMQELWGQRQGDDGYSRRVLTAYAAARLAPSEDFADSAGDLIASMLAAGLDRNAARWAEVVEPGSQGWALLALGSPGRSSVSSGALDTFYDDDGSERSRRTRFLVAGLAGLERISLSTAQSFASRTGTNLDRATRWTRAIDSAAASGNQALVVFLAGAGMQGDSWDKMTAVHLYHIVSALRRVGLEAEARMIAAEAVARA